MALVWDEAMFRKYYILGAPNGQYTTYSRIGWRYYRGPESVWGYPEDPLTLRHPDHPMNEYRWRVERLTLQFPIQPSSRILVLGCGSGFLPEVFIWWKMQNGIAQATAQSQVAGIDNSTYIQQNITAEAHPLMLSPTRVVGRSLLDGTGVVQMRNALRNLAGGSEFFDFVITESVIESYTAAERTNFLNKCETYKTAAAPLSHVIHIACDGWDASADGGSPAMTLEEWAATRPSHSWISYLGDMRVIPGV